MVRGTIGSLCCSGREYSKFKHRLKLCLAKEAFVHDNTHIEIRCRALWADVLNALETRITSVNRYVPEQRAHIVCHKITPEAVHLHHASSDRSVIATLDLKKHAIHLKEYHDREMERPLNRKDMPLSMLADGEVYVTDGNELKANAMKVAKALLEVLLARKAAKMSA